MANRRRSAASSPVGIVLALVLLAVALGSYLMNGSPANSTPSVTVGETADAPFQLHMIDVGNADCLLIEQGEHAMLIDAGEKATANEVVDELRALGIQKLELVIATHLHADHIGGMATVIDNFTIDTFLMRRVPDSLTPTSSAYQRMLSALVEKEVSTVDVTDGGTYTLGDAAITVYPQLNTESSLNNYSIVCKIVYGDTSFLLTGDAESSVEKALINEGYDLRADVLKIGHHGSSTSTSAAFLQAVSPTLALIPCGADNSYGHPHAETIDTLEARGVTYYRADLYGTVIVASDGSTLSVSTEKTP